MIMLFLFFLFCFECRFQFQHWRNKLPQLLVSCQNNNGSYAGGKCWRMISSFQLTVSFLLFILLQGYHYLYPILGFRDFNLDTWIPSSIYVIDVEDGHTLHLVVRQPSSESTPDPQGLLWFEPYCVSFGSRHEVLEQVELPLLFRLCSCDLTLLL